MELNHDIGLLLSVDMPMGKVGVGVLCGGGSSSEQQVCEKMPFVSSQVYEL